MAQQLAPSRGHRLQHALVTVPDNWRPTCIKRSEWPTLDQSLWEEGCTEGDPINPGGHGSTIEPESRHKVTKGYGCWLSFLAANGWLEETSHPAERITRERLMQYFKAMLSLKRRGYSILGRFIELRMAMKIMAPKHDTRYILRPNGVTIRQMLGPSSRPMVIPDSGVLFQWGLRLMKQAKLDAPHRLGLVAYRDGLLIAMLAARGRRLRSMSLLRLGNEFLLQNGKYHVELQPHQVKTKKYDTFDLPDKLTPYIQEYLEVVRPALLRGRQSDALWIGQDGDDLKAKGIQRMICVRSKARFGVAFGPHRFRHAIATTAPLRDPTTPGLGASVMAISMAVNEAHYNRANQVMALQQYDAIIQGLL